MTGGDLFLVVVRWIHVVAAGGVGGRKHFLSLRSQARAAPFS